MKYEAVFKSNDGKTVKTFQGETIDVNSATFSNVPKDFKLPRSYGVKKEGNEEFYNNLLPQVGKTLRIESDVINGLFNISLDIEEIVLKEVL